MALTLGTGSFADPQKAGERFNFPVQSPEHTLYWEDSPKRVRVVFEDVVIADSRDAKMLHETGHLPVYYFPEKDVDFSFLQQTDHHTSCPFKGEASYWNVKVGNKTAELAVWSYAHPLEETPPIQEHFAFYPEAMDAWWEEEERIFGHPRDPYHRVDVCPGAYEVIVSVNGEEVARSYRPMLLFETGLPTRYYLPKTDISFEKFRGSITQTVCPYKGYSRYWSVQTKSKLVQDLAWAYEKPLPEAEKVKGYLCFPQEHEQVEMKIKEL